ncbi:hypothetical protein CPAR01_13330, partial [Colletotrichum paranaense]
SNPPGVGGRVEWVVIKRCSCACQSGRGAGRFGLMSKASASFLGRVAKRQCRGVAALLDTCGCSAAIWGVFIAIRGHHLLLLLLLCSIDQEPPKRQCFVNGS